MGSRFVSRRSFLLGKTDIDESDETKRTEVDHITHEVILELVRIKLNNADVLSVMAIVLHGDLGCPVNGADVLALNIVPLSIDQLEERLELDVLIDHLL